MPRIQNRTNRALKMIRIRNRTNRALKMLRDQNRTKLAVQQDGLALVFVKNQTDDICKLAVQNTGHALRYVNIMLQPWKIVNKLLDLDKDNICPISYKKIELNDNYCTCSTCSNSFKADALMKWVKKNKPCPMCRSLWTKTNYIIYNNIIQ